jgi:hypothetical protein
MFEKINPLSPCLKAPGGLGRRSVDRVGQRSVLWVGKIGSDLNFYNVTGTVGGGTGMLCRGDIPRVNSTINNGLK